MDQYLFPILLFAHVFGAIVTFGPSFVFPFLARQSRATQFSHVASRGQASFHVSELRTLSDDG